MLHKEVRRRKRQWQIRGVARPGVKVDSHERKLARAAVAAPVELQVAALHEPRGPAFAVAAAVVGRVVGSREVVRLRSPDSRVAPVRLRALRQEDRGVRVVVEDDTPGVPVAGHGHSAIGQTRAGCR